jgi:hypothetical protein
MGHKPNTRVLHDSIHHSLSPCVILVSFCFRTIIIMVSP